MTYNSSNYFAYKKNKYRRDIEQPPKPISKINFLFQLFVATFVIMFIIIVISIMKYSSKMDIEYSKKNAALGNNFSITSDINPKETDNDVRLKIDKRLLLIQQEENAPSEAKIIKDEKEKSEVIDPVHIENNKKIEKTQKIQNTQISETKEEIKPKEAPKPGKATTEDITDSNNITIMSKVLVGRFSSFDEAKRLQEVIKAKDTSLKPYVKKVGEVYTVQLGSYQDFNIAKAQAQLLKSKGLDVWIYKQ